MNVFWKIDVVPIYSNDDKLSSITQNDLIKTFVCILQLIEGEYLLKEIQK